MKKPQMILFDYGNTLLYEPDVDFVRATESLLKYAKSNKRGLTPKEICNFSQFFFDKVSNVRKMDLEIHQWQFQRFLYEYLEIDLFISQSEVERIFWNSVSEGALMPNVDKMLDAITRLGIRSGVISNIGWSEAVLSERINHLLPKNKFEFIIASSEYVFRKPSPMLFELALRKAGLDAENVWFCGDSLEADIEGSAAVGMFPVWYDNKTIESPWRRKNDRIILSCEHLHIHDWSELIKILQK